MRTKSRETHMKLFVIILMTTFFLSGCSSTSLKTIEPLDYSLNTKTYNKKTKDLVDGSTEVLKAIDKDQNKYFRVTSQGKYLETNNFSIKYYDEYIYLIDEYLSLPSSFYSKKNIGMAHSTWKNIRLGFLVVPKDGGVLNVYSCIVGVCDRKGVDGIFYDRDNAIKLRNYLAGHSSQFSMDLKTFSPDILKNPDKALVYLYKMNSAPLYGKATIKLNGEAAGNISSREYLKLEINSGVYEVTAEWGFLSGIRDSKKTFRFESGKTYYLKYSSKTPGEIDKSMYILVGTEHDERQLKLEHPVIAKNDLVNCMPAE